MTVGTKIDFGNRMLSIDYVPRDENGTPIDPKTAGVMHLYKVVCQLNHIYMYYSNLLHFTLSLQMKQSVQTNEPGVSKMYICIT